MSINNEAYFNVTFTLDSRFDERLRYFSDYVKYKDDIDWTDTNNLANYSFYKNDNSGLNYNLTSRYIKKEHNLDRSSVNNIGKMTNYKNMEQFTYTQYSTDRQELFMSKDELIIASEIRQKYENNNLFVNVYSKEDLDNNNNGKLLNFKNFKHSEIKIYKIINDSIDRDINGIDNFFDYMLKEDITPILDYDFNNICFIEDLNLFFVNHYKKNGDMTKTVNIINNKIFENTRDFTERNIDLFINSTNLLDNVKDNKNAINDPIINNPYIYSDVRKEQNINNSTNNLLSPFLISVRDPRNKGNEFFVKDNFNDNEQNYLFSFDDISGKLYFSNKAKSNDTILQEEFNYLKLSNKQININENPTLFSDISDLSYNNGDFNYYYTGEIHPFNNNERIIIYINNHLDISFNNSIFKNIKWITTPEKNKYYEIINIHQEKKLFNHIHTSSDKDLLYNYVNNDMYDTLDFMINPDDDYTHPHASASIKDNSFVNFSELIEYINIDAPISNNYQSYSRSINFTKDFENIIHFYIKYLNILNNI